MRFHINQNTMQGLDYKRCTLNNWKEAIVMQGQQCFNCTIAACVFGNDSTAKGLLNDNETAVSSDCVYMQSLR